ncbi:MAG: two-component system, OmpR family, sensor histidine kinase MprB [Solirubrobacteraceae bacterium]|nr:two-component system, OmpR family, sensor histidine kinase MprB [Solirubrobacteraceae bacterium]
MSFRRRITLAAAAAVAVAVAITSLFTYVLVRHQLRGEIDSSLRHRGAAYVRRALQPRFGDPAASTVAGLLGTRPGGIGPAFGLTGTPATRQGGGLVLGGPTTPVRAGGVGSALRFAIPVRPGEGSGFAQLVSGSGSATKLPASEFALPVTAATRALARAGHGSTLSDANVAGQHVRILTEGFAPGLALELARPLGEIDSSLGSLRLLLVLLTAGGIAFAAVLGRFVAGAAVAPVKRLTDAAEHVAATQDLGQRIDTGKRDELGRLATSFNGMLDALDGTMRALDESARVQRQLVADASHELRTPVTSLRTNIEILEQAEDLPDGERTRLVSDIVEQLEELSALIGDLTQLARDDEPREAPEEVRLDTLVAEAISRAARNAPAARFDLELEQTIVSGIPARLDRAINNLLGNAVKFSGTQQAIEVRLRGGELTIRDHGPGIDAADLPHVFDRFYRGAGARALPGSGLGLAIVRQVVDQHEGEVTIETPLDGGTLARLRLPTV